jgi:hypothetical protein
MSDPVFEGNHIIGSYVDEFAEWMDETPYPGPHPNPDATGQAWTDETSDPLTDIVVMKQMMVNGGI